MVSPVPRLVVSVVVLMALVIVALVLVAAPAGAHTDFVGSDPKDGARLDEVPREVALEFSDDMDPRLSTITLSIEGGSSSPLEVTGGARATVLVAQVPDHVEPTTGRETQWTITFRVVSRDGHPVSGTTGFVVRTAATSPAPSDESSPTASKPSPTTNPDERVTTQAAADPAEDRTAWPLVAVGIGVLVLLGGAVAATMRLTGQGRDA